MLHVSRAVECCPESLLELLEPFRGILHIQTIARLQRYRRQLGTKQGIGTLNTLDPQSILGTGADFGERLAVGEAILVDV